MKCMKEGKEFLLDELRSFGVCQDDKIEEWFDKNYLGCFESVGDYVRAFLEESGQLGVVPNFLIDYIDYESLGRDFEIDQAILVIEKGYQKLYIFRGN